MNRYEQSGAISRLSRLPKLNRTATAQKTMCGACESDIEADNDYLNRVKVCRKCLDAYSKVDSLLNAAAMEKAQAQKLAIWGAKI